MVHNFLKITAFCLTIAPFAPAFGQQANNALPKDVQAKFQTASAKACDDDLNHDRFGAYASVDECVADKLGKMERDYRAGHAATQTVAGTPRR
jgi:hypothetical protein